MPQIGPLEILVVSLLGLIVFGPDKLPEIARTVGAFLRQMRAMADDMKQEFSDGFDVDDEPEDEELVAITRGDDDEELGASEEVPTEGADDAEEVPTEGPTEGADDAEQSPEGRPEPPADHPIAEAIDSERDAKGSGREA